MRRLSIIILSVMLILMCSCHKNEKYNIEKPDYPCAAGNITVYSSPEKVAVIHSQVSKIMDELGLSDRISAEGNYSERNVPKIGSSSSADIDAVISSGAAMLISDYELPVGDVDKLTKKNIQLLVIPKPTTPDGIKTLMLSVDRLFFGANSVKYEPLWKNYSEKLDSLRNVYSKTSAVYITNRDLTSDITLSGGIISYIFSVEDDISSAKPEYVFCGGNADTTFISGTEWYESTPACEKGRIYQLQPNFFDGLLAEDLDNFEKILTGK